MAKLLVVVLCAAVAGVLAEPPSSYLPPQARNAAPSAQYGAPFGGFNGGSRGASTSFHSQRTGSQSFSYNSQHGSSGSSFRNAGHGTFGSSRKSSFGARSFAGNGRQGFAAPASTYSAPASTYSAPAPTFSAPAPTYSAPSQAYSAPSQAYSAPSSTYGAPSQGFARQGSFSSAAAGHGSFGSFGASSGSSRGFSAGQGFAAAAQSYSAPSSQYGPPSTQYGPPSARYGAPFGKKMDDDLSEPANYEYRYQVLAGDESGAEFGHQESRENEAAKGQYHVLLPDGRMQIVEYEADEEGFRPNIRYEETGAYPAARNNGYNGLEGPY